MFFEGSGVADRYSIYILGQTHPDKIGPDISLKKQVREGGEQKEERKQHENGQNRACFGPRAQWYCKRAAGSRDTIREICGNVLGFQKTNKIYVIITLSLNVSRHLECVQKTLKPAKNSLKSLIGPSKISSKSQNFQKSLSHSVPLLAPQELAPNVACLQ